MIKMSSERDDDLFDVAMWLACDKRLDADLAEFRRYDEMPCQFSREYRRNVKYILSHGGRRRTPHHTKLHASMKRVAACFAACISLFFCSCFCFPAVRAEVARLAVEFYDKYLGISDERPSVIGQEIEHHAPTYLPEGYELVEENYSDYWTYVVYSNQSGKQIIYSQNDNRSATRYFDSEGAMLSDVFINEYRGKFLEYTDRDKTENFIMWTDGIYTYYITAELPYEEMKAIAESVS